MLSTIGDSSLKYLMPEFFLIRNLYTCFYFNQMSINYKHMLILVIWFISSNNFWLQFEFSQLANMIFCTPLHNIKLINSHFWISSSLLLKEQTKVKISGIWYGSKFQFLILLSAAAATDILNWAQCKIWNIFSLKTPTSSKFTKLK